MAEKLQGFLLGDRAVREVINQNAEELSAVETGLDALRTIVQRQAEEILHLRAMISGIVEILQAKVALDDAELEQAVRAAQMKLAPPPKSQRSTDPYRNGPGGEPLPEEVASAKTLLANAQDHHFYKRFQEARVIYQQIVDKHGDTKQAAIARQQLENLRGI